MEKKTQIIIGSFIGTFVLMGIIATAILIPGFNVNAADDLLSTNVIEYKDDDMTVTFTDDKSVILGSITLMSHDYPTQIKPVGYGGDFVVMYYDFKDWELLENGLGDVTFIDKKTDKVIERDFDFVEFTTMEREFDDRGMVCRDNVNKSNSTQTCTDEVIDTHMETVWDWKILTDKNIPKGDVRIGLQTYVEKGDYLDAIWKIAGKEIDKHATWNATFDAGNFRYFKFDETSGDAEDFTGTKDGTVDGADYEFAGKINTAYDYILANTDYVNTTNNEADLDDYSINAWMWFDSSPDTSDDFPGVVSMLNAPGNDYAEGVGFGAIYDPGWWFHANGVALSGIISKVANNTFGDGLSYDTWHMVTLTVDRDKGTNGVQFYVDGVYSVQINSVNNPTQRGSIHIGARQNTGGLGMAGRGWWDGGIDELGLWSRVLTPAEVTDLYNSGDGLPWGTPEPVYDVNWNITGVAVFDNGTGVNLADIFAVWQGNNTVAANTTSNSTGGWNLANMPNSTYLVIGYDPTNASIDGDVEAHVVLNV